MIFDYSIHSYSNIFEYIRFSAHLRGAQVIVLLVMPKRGRKPTWWGWEYFEPTGVQNESGDPTYACQVPVKKDGGPDLL